MEPQPAKASCSVVLIDRDADHALRTRNALARCPMPIDVQYVKEGSEAFDVVREQAAMQGCDLVLLSLYGHDEASYDLLAALKSDPTLMTIPVVITASDLSPAAVHTCYRMRINGIIPNDEEVETFLTSLANLATFWLSSSQTVLAAA